MKDDLIDILCAEKIDKKDIKKSIRTEIKWVKEAIKEQADVVAKETVMLKSLKEHYRSLLRKKAEMRK